MPTPVISAPVSFTVAVDGTTPLPGISVAEQGSLPGEIFTVTLFSPDDLSATGPGVSKGFGNYEFTYITGSLAQVNADLATLVDTAPHLDPNGPRDGIDVAAVDGTGNASAEITIFVSAACYCPGTHIETPNGEIAIENLVIGDTVITRSGIERTIRWIGRRTYDGRFIAGNHLMLPICFKAGSLADGVPVRDLHVSPGHAMYVDDQLVPAWRLVNGVSITQADSVDQVSYLHIELDRHDVIFAEGAPAESFLDDGCRAQFHNASDFHARHPDAQPMAAFAPRLEDGFALQFIQDWISVRAGIVPPVEPAGPLRGYIDQAGPDRVCGWAQDEGSPEDPVVLEISVDDVPVLCVLANAYRADLCKAGVGSGCHAFAITLPDGLDGPVVVRRVADGAVLGMTDAADLSQCAA